MQHEVVNREKNLSRRQVLRLSGVVSLGLMSGLIKPSEVFAAEWPNKAFDAKNVADALRGLGGESFAESADVELLAPDIAENGAVVPVSVSCKLPGASTLAILVEKNPMALSGVFSIPAGTMAAVSTRIKMSGTSVVYALVKVDKQWLMAAKEVKVTLGGCGG